MPGLVERLLKKVEKEKKPEEEEEEEEKVRQCRLTSG